MVWPFQKKNTEKTLSSVSGGGSIGWRNLIIEPFTGAWQKNKELNRDTMLSNFAIFACATLIASDISKLRNKLVKLDPSGIWVEVPYGDYRVIDKPNGWQNRIQFYEHWVLSKLIRGNTYALKERDTKGKVKRLYILSPDLVTVLVSDSGDVFYQLSQDNLAKLETSIVVPASEIIHDRFNCLFHPLCGISPIFASALAAYQGLKIQENSGLFFKNMSQPRGILSAPGSISDETASRLKASWELNYGGENVGKVAVLGDDLKYQPLAMTADESQMVEQLKLSAKIVCSAFHVPPYKVIDDAPSYNNIEALELQYYNQCLQVLIESIELCLDEGLEIPDNTGTEFDLDGLLRMDSANQVRSLAEEVKGSISTPNEARKRRNMKPLPGGDTIYMQQQNYSLDALARRDAKEDPFETSSKQPTAPAVDDNAKAFLEAFTKEVDNIFGV